MIAKLRPNRVRRTYRGGGRIDAFTGYSPPDDGTLRPEDWLASTTTAFNGTLEIEGEGLGHLEDGRLVKDVFGTLPILVKLLDSDERLVIQAHPTVPFAKRHLNSPVGKTECWYFLPGTDPNACVYLGFKPGVTREKWAAAIRANWSSPVGAFPRNAQVGEVASAAGVVQARLTGSSRNCPHGSFASGCEGTAVTPVGESASPVGAFASNAPSGNLTDFLNEIPVRPGDLVFVEGGMPHAIGAGCFMIELQEPSDLMVVAERWTPSGREIPEGKRLGGLDWEKMLDVYSYESMSIEEIRSRFVRAQPVVGPELTDKFEMGEIGAFRGNAPTGEVAPTQAVIVVTEGAGTLNGLAVRKGDRLVAKDEAVLTLTGAARAVVCRGGRT